MTVLIVIIVVVIILALAGYIMFLKACRRTRKPPVQSVDRPGFLQKYPDIHRQVLRGRQWFEEREWERVELRSDDGLRLVGFFHRRPDARGTVLMVHGYRSDGYTDFSCAYEFYDAQGFNLMMVHQRSHGESEGKYICFGIRERHDCLLWANYLAGRLGPEHDIFISGVSMGCATVLMSAGLELPESVRGLLADCGYTSAWEELSHVMKKIVRIPKYPFLPIVNWYCRVIAGFDLRECSTADILSRTSIPVFFLHGEADPLVPCEMSKRAHAACASEKVFLTVPGAGHGVSYPMEPERVQRALAEFMDRHCRPSGLS